jgi:hypothetical protein
VPEFIIKLLESMGAAGAIIFVLMTVISGLAEVIRRMYSRSNKVYGYRLAERDTLNKALSDTARVLGDMLKATEERNDLTQEQADLILKQSMAFEMLKVTILSQYENIRDNNQAVSQSVAAMADAIRVLTSMVADHRNLAGNQVSELKHAISACMNEVRKEFNDASRAHIIELRKILGSEVTTIRRRKTPT